MVLALVLSGLLGDVAPPRPPVPRPAQCTADTDCELSTFAGCCGSCCPSEPHAVPRGTKEGVRCMAIDCALPDCAAVRCGPQPRPASEFVAACRSGQCIALPRPQGPQECRVDLDCRVIVATPPAGDACHRSACGCCPVSQAVPSDGPVPLQQRPSPEPKKKPEPGAKPSFGLSTGEGQPPPPPAPQCSPCPRPVDGKAACLGGRCVLAPMPRPIPRPPMPRPPPVG